MVNPQGLGLNLASILDGLIGLAALLILVIALLTGARYVVWRSRRAAAEAVERGERQRPDGTPPPAGCGICTACARAGAVTDTWTTVGGRAPTASMQ